MKPREKPVKPTSNPADAEIWGHGCKMLNLVWPSGQCQNSLTNAVLFAETHCVKQIKFIQRPRNLPRRTYTDLMRVRVWVYVVLLRTGMTLDELARTFPEIPFVESRDPGETPTRLWRRWFLEGHVPTHRYLGMTAPEYVDGWPPAAGAFHWYHHPIFQLLYELEAALMEPTEVDWVAFCNQYQWALMEDGVPEAPPVLMSAHAQVTVFMEELMQPSLEAFGNVFQRGRVSETARRKMSHAFAYAPLDIVREPLIETFCYYLPLMNLLDHGNRTIFPRWSPKKYWRERYRHVYVPEIAVTGASLKRDR